MAITVEAIYENGVLKPAQPLEEHEKVRIQVEAVSDAVRRVRQSAGLIPCTDQAMIEWAARDSELDYPAPARDARRYVCVAYGSGKATRM